MFKRLRLNSAKSRLVDERLYELVMDELESGKIRRGVWAKALAKSNGSESQAQSKYLELRVESLKDEAHVVQSIQESDKANPDLIEVKKCSNEKGLFGKLWDLLKCGTYTIILTFLVLTICLTIGLPKGLVVGLTIGTIPFTWGFFSELVRN